MSQKIACIILAAGSGTRMKSDIAKPLHQVASKPMVLHVIDACAALNPEKIVTVIAPDMDDMKKAVGHHDIAYQKTVNGTGGAVLAAKENLKGFDGDILVVFGDTPLVTTGALQKIIDTRHENDKTGVVFSGFNTSDPTGYGRMDLNDDGQLVRIIEHKDANDNERKISLCNGGIMCAEGNHLFNWLENVDNNNAQGEYYLTSLPQIAERHGYTSRVCEIEEEETAGVNSRADLAYVENLMQKRLRARAMENGVTLIDPDSVTFCADTVIEQDVVIHPHVVFGPNVVINSNVTIHAFSHIEGAIVHSGASIGPYARLRPGSEIGQNAKVGNFVELKKTKLGTGSKASHLSYLGDAVIGNNVNIGAGTITCNYDGYNKFETHIADGAFIGSNTALVAPVKVGKGAIIAAGSTVTSNVDDEALALARAHQTQKDGWAKNFKDKQEKK